MEILMIAILCILGVYGIVSDRVWAVAVSLITIVAYAMGTMLIV